MCSTTARARVKNGSCAYSSCTAGAIPSEWTRCAEERGCGAAKQSSPAIAVGRASWCAAGPSVHPPCDGNRHGDVGAQGGEVGDAPVALASEQVDVNVGHV